MELPPPSSRTPSTSTHSSALSSSPSSPTAKRPLSSQNSNASSSFFVYGFNQKEYDAEFSFSGSGPTSLGGRFRKTACAALPDCSHSGLRKLVHRRIPCTKWLAKYQWRSSLPRDFIAGATLGIYNIPQGMAYSVLASLPPVFGLYASFFPPLFYFVFGSSFHSSFGVFSITSLLAGQTRLSLLPDTANGTEEFIDGMGPFRPIDVISTLALTVGLIQLIMAACRLDFLTAYLSDPVVSGFNLGAACHALVAQFPALLGVKTAKRPSEFFVLFKTLADIVESIPMANAATVITSAICIMYLVVAKIVTQKIRYLKLFPNELVLMIMATILSLVIGLEPEFKVKIIETVPTGMPSPAVPNIRLIPYVIQEAISISIVAFAVTVSMGKLFGKKHKYSVDTNQELLALGLGGTFSSFFSVFPCSTSLSRSLVNEAAGARTQISGLFSSFIVLLVILWIGPLLSSLPLCVLSSIVVVALRSLFMKVTELPYLFRFSKTDFAIWIVTALSVICYDIIQGLAVGILFALFTVILRTQFARTRHIVEVSSGDFRDARHFPSAVVPSVPVIRFDAPPLFTNCELLRAAVGEEAERVATGGSDCDVSKERPWKCIVLDCSTWTHTDSMGVEIVRELHIDLCNKQILLMFANVRSSVRLQYEASGLYSVLSDNQFYPSIGDALKVAASISSESSFHPFPDLKSKLAKYLSNLPLA